MPKPASEEIRLQWKETVLKQRESGLSVNAWCRKHGIAVYTFRYWQDKLSPKPPIDRTAFNEIPTRQADAYGDTGFFLTCQGIEIHVSKNFDPVAFRQCLKALKEMAC